MIDNDVYETLGERWYSAKDDPVALLRAEARLRNPWLVERIANGLGSGQRVLDIGCGGGFTANHLAREGHRVTGIDLSPGSLAVARRHDATGGVCYLRADALALPFPDASFDAACAMDFLEHTEDPARAVREAARVLRAGGLFFFHTFNRNLLSRLLVIKGVECFVKNTPKNLHVHSLFIPPSSLRAHCAEAGLDVEEMRGVAPVVASRAFIELLLTREVPEEFRFRFTDSLRMAYLGVASRRGFLQGKR